MIRQRRIGDEDACAQTTATMVWTLIRSFFCRNAASRVPQLPYAGGIGSSTCNERLRDNWWRASPNIDSAMDSDLEFSFFARCMLSNLARADRSCNHRRLDLSQHQHLEPGFLDSGLPLGKVDLRIYDRATGHSGHTDKLMTIFTSLPGASRQDIRSPLQD